MSVMKVETEIIASIADELVLMYVEIYFFHHLYTICEFSFCFKTLVWFF